VAAQKQAVEKRSFPVWGQWIVIVSGGHEPSVFGENAIVALVWFTIKYSQALNLPRPKRTICLSSLRNRLESPQQVISRN
jgi:hypothetical protein